MSDFDFRRNYWLMARYLAPESVSFPLSKINRRFIGLSLFSTESSLIVVLFTGCGYVSCDLIISCHNFSSTHRQQFLVSYRFSQISFQWIDKFVYHLFKQQIINRKTTITTPHHTTVWCSTSFLLGTQRDPEMASECACMIVLSN